MRFRLRVWHIVLVVVLCVFTSFMVDLATNPIFAIALLGKYPEQLIIKFGKLLGGNWAPLGSFVFWLTEAYLIWIAYCLISKLIKSVRNQWKTDNKSKGKKW